MKDDRFHEDKDLDDFFLEWAYNPQELNARLVRASDGRYIIQMRVELGILQMEVKYRPDGTFPFGFKTYLSYLKHLALFSQEKFELTREHIFEIIRELRQYGYRRSCWLALGRYSKVILDADYSLALMNFVYDRAPDSFWGLVSEKERSLILLHRTQAAAMLALRKDGPVQALEEIESGIRRFQDKTSGAFSFEAAENAGENASEQSVEWHVYQLLEMRSRIRRHYGLAPTLEEQLREAVQSESYEQAAQIRDMIAKYGKQKPLQELLKENDTVRYSCSDFS